MRSWFNIAVKNYVDIPLVRKLVEGNKYRLQTNNKKRLGVFVGSDIYLGDTTNGVIVFKATHNMSKEYFIRFISYEEVKLDGSNIYLFEV